ncbi:MAG: glycosyltransferase family 1 protein [Elainellaceae cyanobacterium]
MAQLTGMRVLVDGYNLEMTRGTGIKTYGISLLRALHELDISTDILFSRDIEQTQNSILDEVLFFDVESLDEPSRWAILRKRSRLALKLLKAVTGQVEIASQIQTSDVVLKRPLPVSLLNALSDLIDDIGILNLRNAYSGANSLFKLTKRYTYLDVPAPIDVFHATYPLPVWVKGAKKITTVHDLIPLRLPYATLDNKRAFYDLVKETLQKSDAIITVSQHSKADILAIYDVDPDKIWVTYQPIALQPLADSSETAVSQYVKKFGLGHRQYILFVGAIEPKKNVGRLIDAYAGIDTDIPLVIVGKKGWLWEDVLNRLKDDGFGTLSRRVRLLEYVSMEDLKHLYAGALCFAFPSLYEGFGLPPLEAMTFDCPVLTSNVSSLPEVCEDAAVYVDPYDVNDIRAKLQLMLEDGDLRNRLIAAGRQRAAEFSTQNYVDRLSKVYTHMVS